MGQSEAGGDLTPTVTSPHVSSKSLRLQDAPVGALGTPGAQSSPQDVGRRWAQRWAASHRPGRRPPQDAQGTRARQGVPPLRGRRTQVWATEEPAGYGVVTPGFTGWT